MIEAETLGYAQGSIVNQWCGEVRVQAGWTKTIPESRDRLQSRLLVWCVGAILGTACLRVLLLAFATHTLANPAAIATGFSLTFAIAVWALRAGTGPAAMCGGMICLLVTVTTQVARLDPFRSMLSPLMTLFLLTFVATRIGRGRKEDAGLAEERRGRRASQVIANLGAAGLVAICADLTRSREHGAGFWGAVAYAAPAMLLAALCEATADTVSSEVGQAFGGMPILLTTLKRVPPGTDGAVSLTGTAAGVAAAGMVATIGVASAGITQNCGIAALVGGVAGLLFDSALGATLERRGWLGNDLVNFTSTISAAIVAWALIVWRPA